MEILVLRVVHVVCGVFWAGGFFMLTLFIEPTTRAMGPDGGKFMSRLAGSKFPIAMMVTGLLTILAGLRLYAVLYAPANGWAPRSPTTMALLTGAATAILALLNGVTVSRPAAARMAALAQEVQQGGGKPTDQQNTEIVKVRGRLVNSARINAVLVGITVILMAVARYVG
ncbi:MAG TPA: hypothetical protein VGI83_05930 [Gemmatimonadales bacterium]|jgi:uncharacterized membrane protein